MLSYPFCLVFHKEGCLEIFYQEQLKESNAHCPTRKTKEVNKEGKSDSLVLLSFFKMFTAVHYRPTTQSCGSLFSKTI